MLNLSACRICFSEKNVTASVQDVVKEFSILEIIRILSSSELLETENRPNKVCKVCHSKMGTLAEMIVQCRKSEEFFKTQSDPVAVKTEDFEDCAMPEDVKVKVEIAELQEHDSLLPKSISVRLEPTKSKRKYRQPKGEKKKRVRKKGTEIKHICSQCGKNYSSNNALKVHEQTHLPEKLITCDFCGAKFSNKTNVKSHILNRHFKIKKFQCNFCPARFGRSSILKAHQNSHTEELLFNCQYCEKSFLRKPTLYVHLRKHTGERPYQCKICLKTYMFHSGYKSHLLTHDNIRPHKCTICGQAFTQKSSMKTHERRHNAQISQPTESHSQL